MIAIDESIASAIVRLKTSYVKSTDSPNFLSEVLPAESSIDMPIGVETLAALHHFARVNPLYTKAYAVKVDSVLCQVYEAEINSYWLSSKKYDSCYQPFYPTWLLSAFALARISKSLGFEELVDIGSGDGRLAYCGALLGMKSYGIEIDAALVRLQRKIIEGTSISYEAIEADATVFDYDSLGLKRPIFFISGLPEMGEMLAQSVLSKILGDPVLKNTSGFNFMGSHVMKHLSRDHTKWGWGAVISHFHLKLCGTVTLPTFWTMDEPIDTAYVYAVSA
jgi:hypothetical protein